MAVTRLKHLKQSPAKNKAQHLKNAICYIFNPRKTDNRFWTYSNCGINESEIYDEMIDTKQLYGKEDGRQGYHFVISFPPGETDAKTCYQVANDFCKEYFGDNYEYAFAVHTDQPHIHAHIVFNSVNRVDGYKYRYVNGDWAKTIQPLVDDICIAHDLPPLEVQSDAPKIGRSYAEHDAIEKNHFTWKSIIKLDIDRAISLSSTWDEYEKIMGDMGYTMRRGNSEKYGTYIAYQHHGMVDGRKSEKARRDYNLGEEYRFEAIKRRIEQPDKDEVKSDTCYYPGSIHQFREHRASRFQVCFVRRFKQARQFHFYELAVREQGRVRNDMLKIEKLQEEVNYIIDNDIDSIDAALERLAELKAKIRELKDILKVNNSVPIDLSEAEIVKEYTELKKQLTSNDISDEEYEAILDRLEEMSSEYSMAFAVVDTSNEQRLLEQYMYEKRILFRLVKEYRNHDNIERASIIVNEKTNKFRKVPAI